MFLYRIVNVKNNRLYVGIVYGKGKTIYDRFEEYMSGKGSIWIKRAIDSGEASVKDFVIGIVRSDFSSHDELRDAEMNYIKQIGSLYPNGYNGNCGNMIVYNEIVRQKSRTTWLINEYLGRHKSRKGMNVGTAMYRMPDGTNQRLSITDARVVSLEVRHVNWTGVPEKRALEIAEEKKIYGMSEKQYLACQKSKDYLVNVVVGGEAWLSGREKFRQRMIDKDFTDKEKEKFAKARGHAINQWKKVPKKDRINITGAGLAVMNAATYTCKYCGMVANKGNIKRWHNENCKSK